MGLSSYWCTMCGQEFKDPDKRADHEKKCKGPR